MPEEKKYFLVSATLDTDKFEAMNAKRTNAGVQPLTPHDLFDNIITDALSRDMISDIKVAGAVKEPVQFVNEETTIAAQE